MKLELCAASIEAVDLAKELKFDRIELCQNLEQGGMTPSSGFIEYALSLDIETHVLIRPRSGGFRYTSKEIDVVLHDVEACKRIGAHGVVVGILDQSDQICTESLDAIMAVVGDMDVTYHRAFDDTYEYDKSLDILINAGVKRVLSAGLARNVDIGMPVLKKMTDYADGRIEIMSGGGVNISNIAKLKNEIQPSAIHFSGTNKVVIDEGSMYSEEILKPNRDKTIRLMNAVR